jgi:hypothetical protein
VAGAGLGKLAEPYLKSAATRIVQTAIDGVSVPSVRPGSSRIFTDGAREEIKSFDETGFMVDTALIEKVSENIAAPVINSLGNSEN